MTCLLRATRIAVASALLFAVGSAARAEAQDADPCAALRSLKNSGSDASGALTECLSKVKGGSLELEPGFYSLEKPVKILDGVTLSTKGRSPESAPCNAQLGVLCAVFVPGPGLSLGKGKGAAPGMLSIEGNDVSLHHLEFDGMNGLSGKQRGALLAVSGARGAKLSRLELRNWSGDSALMVSKAENVSVELSRFKDNGSEKSLTSHMEVKGGRGVTVSGNLLQDSSKFAVSVSGCSDCKVRENVVWQTGSPKASALVGVRAVGTSVQVRKNYVDCSVFGCASAFFFGKNGDSAASGDAAKGSVEARNNVASHSENGFFFGKGTAITLGDNFALANVGDVACGKRASAAFAKLPGASVDLAQARVPGAAQVVEASFSAKAVSQKERAKCVSQKSDARGKATGDEAALKSVPQVIFPFLLGRSPSKDEQSAAATQLAAGVSLKDLFIGLDALKKPDGSRGDDVSIMAYNGKSGSSSGSQHEGASGSEKGEKAKTSAAGGPTVVIASATAQFTSLATPLQAVITFSEAVTGFVAADVSATSATVAALSPWSGVWAGKRFTVTYRPRELCRDISLSIAADRAVNAARTGNQASAAPLTVRHSCPTPTLSFADAGGDSESNYRIINIEFTKPFSGLNRAFFSCINCSVSAVEAIPGAPLRFRAAVNVTGRQQISLSLPARPNVNVAASNVLTWTRLDPLTPTVTLEDAPENRQSRTLTVTFNRAVTNFSASSIVCNNCSASQVGSSSSGTDFTFTLTATDVGTMSAFLPAGAARSGSSTSIPSGNFLWDWKPVVGASELADSSSGPTYGSFKFQAFVPPYRDYNIWKIRVRSSASPVFPEDMGDDDARWDLLAPQETTFISPELNSQPQSPPNRYLPCVGVLFQEDPVSSRVNTASPVRTFFAGACETLVANVSRVSGGTTRVLKGIFNAPNSPSGRRPVSVRYAVVNTSASVKLSQQTFPRLRTEMITSNAAGAALKTFEQSGPQPCFDIMWLFNYSNGTASNTETKRVCGS